MKKIVIQIEITEEETLEAYEDVSAELILDDFVSNPLHWLNLINTIVKVTIKE